jgi:hypothetical protein
MDTLSTTTATNPVEILAKIDACDTFLAECRTEAETLSLAAVEGEEAAGRRLAEVRAKMDGAAADRTVLEDALRAARLREQANDRTKAEARRAKHHDAAEATAKRLLDLAGELDKTISRFGELAIEISLTERQVWTQLTQADARPRDSITGRNGIAEEAFAHVNNVLARGDFRTKRSLADTVLIAWAMLLGKDDADVG